MAEEKQCVLVIVGADEYGGAESSASIQRRLDVMQRLVDPRQCRHRDDPALEEGMPEQDLPEVLDLVTAENPFTTGAVFDLSGGGATC